MPDERALTDLTILVVDDNEPMRALIRGILEAFGISNIREAADGFSAYKDMQAVVPDVVITDLVMQPVDGLTFTRFVRTDPDSPAPDVPILMVTGLTEKSRVEEARDAGVTEFLAKPVTPKAIALRLAAAVEKPRPFIRAHSFVGPDRRRRQTPLGLGIGRRATDEASEIDAEAVAVA